MQVHIYEQIDNVILDGRGQACPGMLKEAIKTFKISKTKGDTNLIIN